MIAEWQKKINIDINIAIYLYAIAINAIFGSFFTENCKKKIPAASEGLNNTLRKSLNKKFSIFLKQSDYGN